MKLWLLEPKQDPTRPSDPWFRRYDKAVGFVIRAKDETSARKLAAERAGEETGDAWTDPIFSTCTQLSARGKAGVILRDFIGS